MIYLILPELLYVAERTLSSRNEISHTSWTIVKPVTCDDAAHDGFVTSLRLLSGVVAVRDYGLLESAVARPQTTVFGKDAYDTVADKAAALLHSLARDHALVDGDKRLALAGMIAFLGINGRKLTLSNDQAYDFVVSVATGELDDIAAIAERIRDSTDAR